MGDSFDTPKCFSGDDSSRDLTSDFRFEGIHLRILVEILADYSSYWKEIAISLGLPDNEIRSITSMMHINRMNGCLFEVIQSWLTQKHKHIKPPTLEVLENTLRSATVGLGTKANDLKKELLEQGILEPKAEARNRSSVQIAKDDEQVFKILDQSRDTKIAEGDVYVLLGVNVSSTGSSGDTTYQWTKNGGNLDHNQQDHRYLGSEESIICVLCNILTVEGSYTCEVIILSLQSL